MRVCRVHWGDAVYVFIVKSDQRECRNEALLVRQLKRTRMSIADKDDGVALLVLHQVTPNSTHNKFPLMPRPPPSYRTKE